MKYNYERHGENTEKVALFTRAWIEIKTQADKKQHLNVALFTRAWIEIFVTFFDTLKSIVALFTRAWIEI